VSHLWRVHVQGNIPAPFPDVVSWWTSAERTSELRAKLERRIGPRTKAVWTEGDNGPARWVQARWKLPGRSGEACWHLVRHEPQLVEGHPEPQLRLTSTLMTRSKTRRGKDMVSHASVETLLIERAESTEVRYQHAWTTTGASVFRQLLTRRALASVAKADVTDLMLRCEVAVAHRTQDTQSPP
jgi:hypothetical protein